MRKLMHKLIMYYKIQKLKKEGFKPTRIGRHLGLDYRTVKKYLTMNEEQYRAFMQK
jgi:hypothetical protein